MNIVFDLGAVLLEWQPAALVAQSFPAQASTAEAAQTLAKQLFGHADWHAFDRGVVAMDDVVTRSAARLQLPHAALQTLVEGIAEQLRPMAETLSILAALRALRQRNAGVIGLYFLSNMPVPYARSLERRHAFFEWFDGGLFSGDVLQVKPEPDIYRLLQSRYALQPERTLFIDDLQGNIDTARELGWQGIHFQSAAQLRADLPLLNSR
jgi:putative hydrolase of the HAD superfamily